MLWFPAGLQESVNPSLLRAQPGGFYCIFSGFLFDFGFWVFLSNPVFVKRPNLKLIILLLVKNSLYFRECSLVNRNKIFHYYWNATLKLDSVWGSFFGVGRFLDAFLAIWPGVSTLDGTSC